MANNSNGLGPLWRATYQVLFCQPDRDHPDFRKIERLYDQVMYARRWFFGSLITTAVFLTIDPRSPIITDITKVAAAALIYATAQVVTEIGYAYIAFTKLSA